MGRSVKDCCRSSARLCRMMCNPVHDRRGGQGTHPEVTWGDRTSAGTASSASAQGVPTTERSAGETGLAAASWSAHAQMSRRMQGRGRLRCWDLAGDGPRRGAGSQCSALRDAPAEMPLSLTVKMRETNDRATEERGAVKSADFGRAGWAARRDRRQCACRVLESISGSGTVVISTSGPGACRRRPRRRAVVRPPEGER